MQTSAGLVAAALILATLGYELLLNSYFPELYQTSVQEDEYLEWATFWAFAAASGVWIAAAVALRRRQGVLPWFPAGLALFCFIVAMEEISWAQRLIGYRPPPYFLANNFQQELNFHNIVDTDLRKLALQAILCGYGVALPLAACFDTVRRKLAIVSIQAPPLALAPVFAVMTATAIIYPINYTGEVVEVMMAQGFLFAAIAALATQRRPAMAKGLGPGTVATAWIVVLTLGLISAASARHARSRDPHALQAAAVELEALKQDFLAMADLDGEAFPTWRSLDKRVYSYEIKYGHGYLYSGQLAQLVEQGLAEERAHFFLDPWNAPYWINLEWSADGSHATAFVYSFGPNRRRESTHTEVRGDDLAAFIYKNQAVSPR